MARGDAGARAKVAQVLDRTGLKMGDVMAQTLRDVLAQRLREAATEIEDAEFEEIPSAEAAE